MVHNFCVFLPDEHGKKCTFLIFKISCDVNLRITITSVEFVQKSNRWELRVLPYVKITVRYKDIVTEKYSNVNNFLASLGLILKKLSFSFVKGSHFWRVVCDFFSHGVFILNKIRIVKSTKKQKLSRNLYLLHT